MRALVSPGSHVVVRYAGVVAMHTVLGACACVSFYKRFMHVSSCLRYGFTGKWYFRFSHVVTCTSLQVVLAAFFNNQKQAVRASKQYTETSEVCEVEGV